MYIYIHVYCIHLQLQLCSLNNCVAIHDSSQIPSLPPLPQPFQQHPYGKMKITTPQKLPWKPPHQVGNLLSLLYIYIVKEHYIYIVKEHYIYS